MYVFYYLFARLYPSFLDTDASSVYEADDMKIKSLTDFNQKIQKEGEEVRRLLDLALSEKRETEKVRSRMEIAHTI